MYRSVIDDIMDCMHTCSIAWEHPKCTAEVMLYRNQGVIPMVVDMHEQVNDPQTPWVSVGFGDRLKALEGTGKRNVVRESVKCNDAVNQALRYLASLMFSLWHSSVEIIHIYTIKDVELEEKWKWSSVS